MNSVFGRVTLGHGARIFELRQNNEEEETSKEANKKKIRSHSRGKCERNRAISIAEGTEREYALNKSAHEGTKQQEEQRN